MERLSKKRLPIWAWLLILAGVAAVLIAGRYIYVIFMDPAAAFGSPPEEQQAEAPSAAPETSKPGAGPTPTPLPTLTPEEQLLSEADLEFLKNKVNILMLGWDESPERNDEDSEMYRDENNNFRSDVLMLLTVDFEAKTAKLISIPRDTMAKIYNTEGRWKINAAFAKGGSAKGNGFEYAMRTISDLLGGIPIGYYVGVNMSGLKDIVDAMGGVDYDVDVRIELNGRVLEKGYQHMTGQQVLDYCRARKGISTDVGRNDRQQRMLFAIFNQLRDKDQLVNLPNVYKSMQDKFNTNLNFEQIAAMTVFAMDLDMNKLTRATLEGEYVTGTPYSHASFYVLDNEKLVALVKEVFGITVTPNEQYGLDYVLGDKTAAEATEYLTASDWLLVNYLMPVLPENVTPDSSYPSRYTEYPYRTEFERELAKDLVSARDGLVETVTREGEEALDTESIKKAQEELRDTLIYAASSIGLTRAHFQTAAERKLLPEDVLSALPEAPSPTPATDPFGDPGGFGFPETDPTDDGIFG
jgi:LCP family protein required for cell wall assembly